MGLQNRLLVLTLIGALVLFDSSEQGGSECFLEGEINYSLFNYSRVPGSFLSVVEGPVETCNSINGEYESICDIGWDRVDAQVVCSNFFGIDFVSETLTGLGFPRTQYSSRTYNCSEGDFGLRSCNYSLSIDPECHNGPHVAGIRCRQVCRDGEVDLQDLTATFEGGLSTYRGRVQICANGTYHSICDIGWDSRDVQVACKYFPGRTFIGEVHPSFPLPPRTRYIAQDVTCNGTESSLIQCSYNPHISPECYVGNHSAGVVCREVCPEGDVLLVNQNFTLVNGLEIVSGVVQVCVNQQYVYVCADNWDNREADVVCRSYYSRYQPPYYENIVSTSSVIPIDAPIYRYSMCNGTERHFSRCQLPRSDSGSTCPSIGVVHCTEVISQCFSEGNFRLINRTTDFSAGGTITVEGRIEVCTNFTYSSLCDYYWNPVDAQVFCQHFVRYIYGASAPANITGQSVAGSQYGYSRAGIAPYDVTCNGSESRLESCARSTASSSFCDDPTRSAAGVICSFRDSASTLPPTTDPTATPTPTITPTCTEFDLQLGNAVYSVTDDLTTGTSRFSVSGNIEICVGGLFYSICDEGWGQEEAQVACNALNYPSRNYRAVPLSGLTGTRPIIAENIMCFGNETHALQCNFTAPPVSPRCYDSSNAAGVECIQVRTPCINEGEINLLNPQYEGYLNIFTGDQVNITGRVGVCRNESYDTVCDANWDASDAAVLCRTIIPDSTAIPVYGLSAGRETVVLEDIKCVGNESNIANCSTSPIGQISNPVCREPNRTAGVICSTTDDYCAEGALRLVDGPTFYEGRVEVCRNSRWLSVCDVDVNSTHAITACGSRFHYGDNATAVNGSAYGQGTGPQLAFCTTDTGYSSYTEIIPIENCTSNPSLQGLCSHSRDLGVRCEPGLLAMSITATDDVPMLGSTAFALECFGIEFPWEARLDSEGWYKSGTRFPLDDSVSTNVLHDSYNPSAFNVTYIFRSQVTFDQPLTINDGGEYSCNVSILLTYPDESTYLLTNSTTFTLSISVPSPLVTITTNGTQYAGTRFEANCFAELSTSDLAPYTTLDYLDSSFNNLSDRLGENPDERIQLLPTRQYNATHLVRTITVDPLSPEDQGAYYCVANTTAPYVSPSASGLSVFLEVFSNDSGGGIRIPRSFLPFGPDRGDLTVPTRDDGATDEINLAIDVVIFGSSYNRFYVNTNGVLSFGSTYTAPSSFGSGFSFIFSPPIIAPFWDDIDITRGGTIHYRQDSNSTITELVQRAIASEYPEAASFQPSLVFVVTWDRVEPYDFNARGLVNTFQVVVASDGIWTFVRFSYGDIQWGGSSTLIGVSGGDGVNFVTHPASLSPSVLSLDNTTTTYRVDGSTTTMLPTTVPITTPPPTECFIQGEILPYLNETSNGGLRSFQGTFEICIGSLYGSVCDIGWNQSATQTLCHHLYGSNYIAEPLYGLGFPRRRYVAQGFNCPTSTTGLESCSYNSLVDTQCFIGPHVAGVRCTERPPPPQGVQGLCSVVVWYSPLVSCENIRGYEVRLYNPRSPRLNVTNRIGVNRTFYIVDEEKLVSSDETYVQVRVIHRQGVGEWSEGISLGCEKPTTPETPPRVYFELNGEIYYNYSSVSLSEIGEGYEALYCKTDKEDCCGTVPNRFGEFYYPNGVQVPIANRRHGFYRNRGDQIIRLNRREGTMSPTGIYRCEIPNADDDIVKIYVTLTE